MLDKKNSITHVVSPVGTLFVFFLTMVLTFFPTFVVAEEWIYVIRSGDNLWSFTQKHLVSMKYLEGVQRLNSIQNPYFIPPGTQLRVPIAWTKLLGQAYAEVIAVQGVAKLRRKGQEDVLLQPGMQLMVDDEIYTYHDAFLTMEFSDKTHLRMQANTHLRLINMQILGNYGLIDTFIDLQQGRIENSVPKNFKSDTRFRIRTPSAVSSVRGTDFRVGVVETTLSSTSEVLAGSVEVDGKNKTVKVPAKYGTVTLLGKSPQLPVKLLFPPDLSKTKSYYQSLPLEIQVDPISIAKAYRVQIASDREFKKLLSELTTNQLPFRVSDLPDGDYWLRVRGIDQAWIEGMDAVIPISLNARPEIPFIISPIPDGVMDSENHQFKWTIQTGVSHYEVMVSNRDDFASLNYYNPEFKGNKLILPERLNPGQYFWRIMAVSSEEGAGPISDTMGFRVLHPAPLLENTKFDEDTMAFAWRVPAEGQSFHFQFARDANFNDVIHDEVTIASHAVIKKPERGTYYLRIKTIASDGFQEPWGVPQTIEVPRGISYWFMLLMLLPLLVLL